MSRLLQQMVWVNRCLSAAAKSCSSLVSTLELMANPAAGWKGCRQRWDGAKLWQIKLIKRGLLHGSIHASLFSSSPRAQAGSRFFFLLVLVQKLRLKWLKNLFPYEWEAKSHRRALFVKTPMWKRPEAVWKPRSHTASASDGTNRSVFSTRIFSSVP